MASPVVVSLFAEAFIEVTGQRVDDLREQTPILQLGLDSVTLLEVIAWFEERCVVRIPDELLRDVHTVGDLGRLVERLQGAARP
jgi:acyl carrier protein